MSYVIRVHFDREFGDDADVVENNPEYAGMTYRQAFERLFEAELQEAYDRSEGALAGHFRIAFVKADPKKADKELDGKVKSRVGAKDSYGDLGELIFGRREITREERSWLKHHVVGQTLWMPGGMYGTAWKGEGQSTAEKFIRSFTGRGDEFFKKAKEKLRKED